MSFRVCSGKIERFMTAVGCVDQRSAIDFSIEEIIEKLRKEAKNRLLKHRFSNVQITSCIDLCGKSLVVSKELVEMVSQDVLNVKKRIELKLIYLKASKLFQQNMKSEFAQDNLKNSNLGHLVRRSTIVLKLSLMKAEVILRRQQMDFLLKQLRKYKLIKEDVAKTMTTYFSFGNMCTDRFRKRLDDKLSRALLTGDDLELEDYESELRGEENESSLLIKEKETLSFICLQHTLADNKNGDFDSFEVSNAREEIRKRAILAVESRLTEKDYLHCSDKEMENRIKGEISRESSESLKRVKELEKQIKLCLSTRMFYVNEIKLHIAYRQRFVNLGVLNSKSIKEDAELVKDLELFSEKVSLAESELRKAEVELENISKLSKDLEKEVGLVNDAMFFKTHKREALELKLFRGFKESKIKRAAAVDSIKKHEALVLEIKQLQVQSEQFLLLIKD